MTETAVAELLKPIAGENPAGTDLRYSPVYEQIKEARREDDGLAQGPWQRERKLADYRAVIKLTKQALKEKSKDLQLAVWLTESLTREEGYTGLRAGLELCFGLLDRFWEYMFPPLEEGDAELRAAPLVWLGSKLDAAVRSVPLVTAGYDWFAYKQSRAVGYDESSTTPDQKKAREKALSDGKLSAEVFDKAFDATPRERYVEAGKDLSGARSVLTSLDQLCSEKFADSAPGFSKLRDAVEEVGHTVRALLQKKGEPQVESNQPASMEATVIPAADESQLPEAAEPHRPAAPDSFGTAMEALRAGHHQRALQLLNRDLTIQSSGRARFLRKLELARACVAAGKDAIAQPLLDDLAAVIDAHKLDEWEEHETVAGALVTILQASKRVQADAKEKQKFFERICRLDPSQALSC
jgi:type VI secretion system protein ImpA